MKCPNCNVELTKDFYHKLINFRCPGCGGRMLTVSAFRNLCADRDFANRLWRAAMNPENASGPGCGSCGKTMRRVALPLGKSSIELDVCQSCQMVWFDPSELESVPLPQPPVNDLPPKAREILALHQIEEQRRQLSHDLRSPGGHDAPDEGWQHLLGMLGLPVETDAPAGRWKPYLTWAIAAICVAVFALTAPQLRSVIADWGFIPAQWSRHYGLTIISAMFLHGGWMHLLGNLYFLLVFGDNVESVFGRKAYLLLIAGSELCSTLLYAAANHDSAIPCVGASGFISGIIACYALCFPQARLSFCLWSRSLTWAVLSGRSWISLPAWGAFLLWLVYQSAMSILSYGNKGGGVAFLAHVGGALAGGGFALYFRHRHQAEADGQSAD